MSKLSNNQGRAYEYACIMQLKNKISAFRKVEVVENSSLLASERTWETMSAETQDKYITSANAAIEKFFELEPLVIENLPDLLELEIQKDDKGKTGDVRDIVIFRQGIKWEIGLSVKHNHFAVKHSRIAKNLDFGEKWFGIPCSKEYWADIKPIFDYLTEEKAKGKKWSELPAKEKDVHIPLLTAFISEVRRSYESHKDLPAKMVEYLLGQYDFYKVISVDNKKTTKIQPYNLHGKLNKAVKLNKPKLIIPITGLPTRLISAEFRPRSNNTVELYFDEGWQFGFRIHNASTMVETSLKFDVQIIGFPATLVCIDCMWE